MSASPRGRVSMAEVGRRAGVSAQTVSRYYSGRGYVSEAARERISRAVAELGYRMNQTARSLRVQRSQAIGVLAVGPTNWGMVEGLAGLSNAARESEYSLLYSLLDVEGTSAAVHAEVRRAIDSFLSSQVDGLVVSTAYADLDALLDEVRAVLPAVVSLSGRTIGRPDTAMASSYSAGLLGTRHLVGLGHRRILHIAGPPGRNETVERIRGYEAALGEAGLAPLPLVAGDWSAESGYRAGVGVDPAAFTGVMAGNDEMALGFGVALRERGLEAPRDYSIVGVDDVPDARFWLPPLTTVRMDFAGLGRMAFEMVREHVESGLPVQPRVIEPDLVVRASTAPA